MISLTEAAKRFGGSPRRWRTLCASGRVVGAEMVGSYWTIPDNPVVIRKSNLGRKPTIKMQEPKKKK